MFPDMMGKVQEMQQKIQTVKANLVNISIESESQEGAIKVTMTASRKLQNIQINPDVVDKEDMEQLEDLVMVAVNRALDKAEQRAAEEMQKAYDEVMPGMGGLPGMDSLF